MHRLSNVDPIKRMATCAICGYVRVRSGGKRQGWRCVVKARELRRNQKQYDKPHRYIVRGKSLEELICSRCGFEPVHACQIDVHHKDRDHSNNSPDNLELLCSNCHRLEHVKGR